ncbi:MAG: glucose-6-phosphate isomerase [Gemmatimonadaceae bacterium]|nr:glucose-6-phosphate isomerase [Gemmatimonadaceae bacterium]
MTLRLDYSNMMEPIASGIASAEWEQSLAAARQAHAAVGKGRADGSVGFLDIASDTRLLAQSLEFAGKVRRQFDDVVILGIGGSALGPIALRTALRAYGWNTLSREERKEQPRLHVLDNVDPVTIGALLDRIVLPRTLFVVTSKSGGTAETMAQFLIVHERLEIAGLPVAHHVVFITDPVQGALRPLAEKLRVHALEIPANVGGRFSILTPVGLLPAALIGIDISRVAAGAADMASRCNDASFESNPALVYATLQWLADTKHGKHVHVFMPYSDPLRDFAAWFVQLWAESLGKQRSGAGVGPTPLAALGATDQHSQVQLFMEGPADKTVTFVAVRERELDLKIPAAFGDVKELGYLGGHSLAELIDVEQRATAGALAQRGRPNMTISLDKIDGWHIGALIMFLEIATAYAGSLYGIDAFNQPGVELGKQFAYAMLGRPGAEAARAEWDSLPKADHRWSV